MELYYEGTNIADRVSITKCIHREFSGGRSDCLEIEFEDAAAWHRWQPKENDQIIAAMNGYDTGILYLNTIIPEDGRFRILATSLPGIGHRKANKSFEGMTLGAIMAACAAECGMTSRLYGLSEGIAYPYIMRQNEGCAAFIDRLMKWEGAVFKAVSGRFTGIGIEYAQSLKAMQNIEISADQPGMKYQRRDNMKLAGITINTPFAECTAVDEGVEGGIYEIYTHYPAVDAVQAGRWARGLLLHHNRRSEELWIESEFNAGFTAMARIDISSANNMEGAWIIDEVTHDFVDKKSAAKMLRCIHTIK